MYLHQARDRTLYRYLHYKTNKIWGAKFCQISTLKNMISVYTNGPNGPNSPDVKEKEIPNHQIFLISSTK